MMDKYKILNRDAIKYIAMFLMLLNHISTIFMKSGKLWSELFVDLGYFTFLLKDINIRIQKRTMQSDC